MEVDKKNSQPRNYPSILVFKGILIVYLIINYAGYLVENTNAYYTDNQYTFGNIYIGTWDSDEQKQAEIEPIEKSESDRVVTDDSEQGESIETSDTGENKEIEAPTKFDDLNTMTSENEGEKSEKTP